MARPIDKARANRSGVYDELRADILTGRLAPGMKLPFNSLVDQYRCSIGAIREALQRLAEQGLVISEWQQGFRVVDVTVDDLRDLTVARCEIETLALRYAILNGDVAWEAAAISAHHVLQRAPRYDPDDPARFSEEWVVAHQQFHSALLAGCGNTRILSIANALRDSSELYRRWSAPLYDRDRDIEAEHRAILDSVVARDGQLASDLLAAHIQRTTDKLIEGLSEDDEEPAAVASR
ncbi:GntR family transcriptional regulator [Mycolicibacterium stellerae]|uniref:GntR family transcriptional regulator n=1 Tax=Mycolicibacterium stellerae TaxID=2358193 RepID=UPI0019CFB032|nr:GntR family transcriptional regulator [Mycolicibacterium stellerae]